MRTCLSLIAASLVASAVSAQATSTNQFEIYSHASDFFSRAGGVPTTSVGDYLLEMRGRSHSGSGFPSTPAFGQDTIAGFGDVNSNSPSNPMEPGSGAGTTGEFSAVFIDGNGSTSEGFNFVIVSESATTARTPSTSNTSPGVLFRSTTVPLPAPLLALTYQWTGTVAVATPMDVIPLTQTWYWGMGFSSTPIANDGIAVESTSFYGLGSPTINFGDPVQDSETTGAGGNMGLGLFGGTYTAPTWARDNSAGTVTQLNAANGLAERMPHMWINTPAPHLQWAANITASGILSANDGMGGFVDAPNPNFGYVGFHPDLRGTGTFFNGGGSFDNRVVLYGPGSSTPSVKGGYVGRYDPAFGLDAGDGLDIVGSSFANGGGTALIIVGAVHSGGNLYFNNPGFTGSITLTLTGAFGLPSGVAPNGEYGAFGTLLVPSVANGAFGGLVLAAQGLSSGGPLPFNPNRFSNSAKSNF